MKVTKAKSAENRSSLVSAGIRLIQEEGFEGAGVKDISAAAGLTQGAFYAQFASKADLAAEACRTSHEHGYVAWSALAGKSGDDVSAYIDQYFLPEHIVDIGTGCPMAAYSAAIPRQDEIVREAFVGGFIKMVELMEAALASKMDHPVARRRALMLISSMSGCLAMARAAGSVDVDLCREIISAAREEFRELVSMAA